MKRVLPPSMRELRKEASALRSIHRIFMSAHVLQRPLMPVSMYCVPFDSTHSTNASGSPDCTVADGTAVAEIAAPALPKLLRGNTLTFSPPVAVSVAAEIRQVMDAFARTLPDERWNPSAKTNRSSLPPSDPSISSL